MFWVYQLSLIDGIDAVYVCDHTHKIFIVLETHDVDRDREIVSVMCEADLGLDWDLVPSTSVDMIPSDVIRLV